jgi:hypothetical protein
LLLVDLVAAVRLGDVLCVRHETSELLLRRFLRGIGDVAEILRHVGRQRAGRNHRRDLRSPAPVRGQHDQRELAQRRRGAHLVEAAIDVDRFKGRVLGYAFPNVAFNQLSLCRPLLGRLRIPVSLGERVDEHEP